MFPTIHPQPVSSSKFPYQPALDGLRAIAVVLILLFNTGVPWMSGGYLGISVFFTLSGYLITSQLLVEHRLTGSISLGDFYARRARRLLPVSMLCVLLVMVARWFGAFSEVASLRADVMGAVLQVSNWVLLAGNSSDATLAGSTTSPLEHYWSLAIAQQFYWVWPLAMFGILRWVGRRRVTAVVVTLTVMFSAAAVVIAAVFGPDAAYWSTPARLPEILVGASLACLLRWPRMAGSRAVRRVEQRGGGRGGPVPPWMALWGPPALVLVIVAAANAPAGSGPAYNGLLSLFAVLTAVLIAALHVTGRVSILAGRPLVAIGKVSYGLYLFHWPVFVALRDRGWDLATPGGMVIAFSLTAAITVVSYRFVERPIRSAVQPTIPALQVAAGAPAVDVVTTITGETGMGPLSDSTGPVTPT